MVRVNFTTPIASIVARTGHFRLVMRGWKQLRKHGVEFNILCTVNAANEHHGRVGLSLLPRRTRRKVDAVHPDRRARNANRPSKSRTRAGANRPATSALLYTQTGNLVTERSVGAQAVRPLPDGCLRGVGAPRRRPRLRADVRRHAGGLSSVAICCASMLRPAAMAPRSNTTATCIPAITSSNPDTGSAISTKPTCYKLVASPEQRKFGLDKRDSLDRPVQQCEVRPLCNGGCPKDRFALSRDGEAGQNYLCAGLELFFTHTRAMRCRRWRKLSRGRPPSEVMAMIAAEDKRARALRALSLRQRQEIQFLPRRTMRRIRPFSRRAAGAATPHDGKVSA